MRTELRRASNVITHTHTHAHTPTDCHAGDRKGLLWDDLPLLAMLLPMVPIVTEEKSTVKCCPTGRAERLKEAEWKAGFWNTWHGLRAGDEFDFIHSGQNNYILTGYLWFWKCGHQVFSLKYNLLPSSTLLHFLGYYCLWAHHWWSWTTRFGTMDVKCPTKKLCVLWDLTSGH